MGSLFYYIIMELNSKGIDDMPYKPEKEIDKIIKSISKELKEISNRNKSQGIKDYHGQAQAEINRKYGKFWRERLDMKKIYNESPFKES